MSPLLIMNVGIEPADFNVTSNDLFICSFNVQSLLHGFTDDGFSPWGPSDVCPAIFQKVELLDVVEPGYLRPVELRLGWI